MNTLVHGQEVAGLSQRKIALFRELNALRGEPYLTTLYIDVSRDYQDSDHSLTRSLDNFWWETWQAAKEEPGHANELFADMLWIDERLKQGCISPSAQGILFIISSGQGIYKFMELPYQTRNSLQFAPWPNLEQLNSMFDHSISQRQGIRTFK